jgi:O-methyltransferase involved in polyketide biosynthesis
MDREAVQFTKEKATLLATLYGRAVDGMSDDPVLGDKTAEQAIERIDYDFRKFRMRRTDPTATPIGTATG